MSYPVGHKFIIDDETKKILLFLKKATEWVMFIPQQLDGVENTSEKIKEITKSNPGATMFSYSAGNGWGDILSVVQAQMSQKTLISLIWSTVFDFVNKEHGIDHEVWKDLKVNISDEMDYVVVIGPDENKIPDFVPQEWMKEFKDE
jgi:hypothetical protein